MKWYRDGKGGALISRKVSDGNYGSFEHSRWYEGGMDADTDITKALNELEATLTQEVEARIDKFLNGQPETSELGAVVTNVPPGKVVTSTIYPDSVTHQTEDKPPLPSDASGPHSIGHVGQETVNVPSDEVGAEYDIFNVDKFKIVVSDGGTKFAKVYGGRWQKFGVTVWEEVMEGVFPIGDLDVGYEFAPPQAMKAKAILNENGNPKKVVDWA